MKNPFKWGERINKAESRFEIFNDVHNVDSALLLPGSDCEDVKHLIHTGKLTKSCHIHAIEREPEYAKDIDNYLKSCGYAYTLHKGELHDYALNSNIDVAFIDLLGNLDGNVTYWLKNVLAIRMKGRHFILNVLSECRANNFIPRIIQMLKAKHNDLFIQYKNMLLKHKPKFEEELKNCADIAVAYYFLINYIFPGKQIDLEVNDYNDSTTMLTFKCKINKKDNIRNIDLENDIEAVVVDFPITQKRKKTDMLRKQLTNPQKQRIESFVAYCLTKFKVIKKTTLDTLVQKRFRFKDGEYQLPKMKNKRNQWENHIDFIKKRLTQNNEIQYISVDAPNDTIVYLKDLVSAV